MQTETAERGLIECHFTVEIRVKSHSPQGAFHDHKTDHGDLDTWLIRRGLFRSIPVDRLLLLTPLSTSQSYDGITLELSPTDTYRLNL